VIVAQLYCLSSVALRYYHYDSGCASCGKAQAALFNIAIIAVYDVAYRSGSLWANLAPVHAFAGLMVVAMSSVVIVSLIHRTSPKMPYRFNWNGVALLVMYGFAMVMLYIMA